jgi:Protein of unknown function (DUF2934)
MPALTTTAKENPKSLAPDAPPTEAEVVEEAVEIYPAAAAGGPTAAEIADEAYRIYLGRGSEHGQDLDDWLEAERRLSPRRQPE